MKFDSQINWSKRHSTQALKRQLHGKKVVLDDVAVVAILMVAKALHDK